MWTEARIEELKTRISAGESRNEIAVLFGCSRNAVAGKAHRLGLGCPVRAKQSGATIINARKKRVRRPGGIKYELLLATLSDESEPLRVSLLDLTAGHCHWVCEGTDDHCMPTYCGHPSIDGRWCEHHYQRVYIR